jgi:hypothetical protein
MFLPLYDHIKEMFPEHSFDLALLPGVGQGDLISGALELPEEDFVKDHDAAFVISFPMIEGTDTSTKIELCCINELGIEPIYLKPQRKHLPLLTNKLAAVHFQGTCLPGSTNPDPELAERIWNDLLKAGYVPIDVHFVHTFHNPENTQFSWTSRNCRDLSPNIHTLQMMIEACGVFVGVASGPFVMAATLMPKKTVYLQKHHTIGCYLKDFKNVVDIKEYKSEALWETLKRIEKG